MENSITLQWKEFSVPVDKLMGTIKNIVGENFDGLICTPDNFQVVFKEAPTQEQSDAVVQFWDSAIEAQFSPSLREIIHNSLSRASVFGRMLVLDTMVENVEMGITQSGKTGIVSDYCSVVKGYMEDGSLYAARDKLTELINAGPPANLAPYITVARLTATRDKIIAYLSTP